MSRERARGVALGIGLALALWAAGLLLAAAITWARAHP